ncbi:hypothetical protein FA95DRAFT_663548 [Auriscalpium vulgare]|uniref:Uncharacterized protein n=1 Tax=Auriscalpium vulgare TaxID=40419 RepID=A0ACB8S0Z3_9AGAM|nr:hypothetical protein FA95DRAFT_663548 [Auriscalpium vulgare]
MMEQRKRARPSVFGPRRDTPPQLPTHGPLNKPSRTLTLSPHVPLPTPPPHCPPPRTASSSMAPHTARRAQWAQHQCAGRLARHQPRRPAQRPQCAPIVAAVQRLRTPEPSQRQQHAAREQRGSEQERAGWWAEREKRLTASVTQAGENCDPTRALR